MHNIMIQENINKYLNISKRNAIYFSPKTPGARRERSTRNDPQTNPRPKKSSPKSLRSGRARTRTRTRTGRRRRARGRAEREAGTRKNPKRMKVKRRN